MGSLFGSQGDEGERDLRQLGRAQAVRAGWEPWPAWVRRWAHLGATLSPRELRALLALRERIAAGAYALDRQPMPAPPEHVARPVEPEG